MKFEFAGTTLARSQLSFNDDRIIDVLITFAGTKKSG